MRLLLCFWFAFSGLAADQPIVLRAARMFDGKSSHIVSPGVVVVSQGKIAGVGEAAAIPAGARVIDLGDATLLPGFMDAHTHLSSPFSLDYQQTEIDPLKKTIAERALETAEDARKTLFAGFTTVRDLGSSDYIDLGMRNAIASGKMVGPRMLVSIHALGSTGGHCDPSAGFAPGALGRELGPSDGIINSPDEARQGVRFHVKAGADVIKVCATGGVMSPTDDVDTPQLTEEELRAVVDEAHALRRKAAAHAHGATGAKRAMRAGIDSIEHGTFLDDEALEMMKARGTYLIPTLMAMEGLRSMLEKGSLPPLVRTKARLAMESLHATVRKAIQKGVRIGLGTDAGVYPHGQNAGEFGILVELGMRPLDALKAGTSVDAELLGVSDRLGTLELGKLADIVACPGNPEQNIRQVEKVFFVMKEGSIFRNSRE